MGLSEVDNKNLTLNQWLAYIECLHAKSIALGLSRVRQVAERMQLLAWSCPVIMVTGTNGKGSTIAYLEQIYHAAGYRVGSFTSPYLLQFTEQIRVNTQPVTEQTCCDAMRQIEHARGEIALTLFEFTTLCALHILQQAQLDVLLLEVGMGGKEDAVNIVDADIAVITAIGFDHQQYLGNSLAAIAQHKAGIMRADKLCVCGEAAPPETLLTQARELSVALYTYGNDFSTATLPEGISYQLDKKTAATACQVVTLLQDKLPVVSTALRAGLAQAYLPGRFQVIHWQQRTLLLDVAHNLQACVNLAGKLSQVFPGKEMRAVLGMLNDKDMLACIDCLAPLVSHWYLTPLADPRSFTYAELRAKFAALPPQNYKLFAQFDVALQAVLQDSQPDTVIVLFGSFRLVSAFLRYRDNH
jgi:dihydrofolate synthase/folylpolyglutamate synthase